MLTDVERLDARGKSFQAATQPDLHTSGRIRRLVLSIMGAFAEFERELIRERTREGIARACAEGKPIGKRGPDKKPRRKRGEGSFKHPPSTSESGRKDRRLKADASVLGGGPEDHAAVGGR